MALASAGARTPFFTSTVSNAATLAFPEAGVRLGDGLGLAGTAAGSAEFAVFSVAVFASLLPAMTGTAVMASTRRLDNHIFSFNIDGVSSFFCPAPAWAQTWGANLIDLHERCQGGICRRNHAVPVSSGLGTGHGAETYFVFKSEAVTAVTGQRDSYQ
jgi:hypothetical protein